MSITKDNHPIIPQLYFIVLICGTLSHFFLNGFSIYTIQLHISAIFCLLFVLFFNRKSGTTISFTLVDLFIVIIGLFLLVNNLLKEGINVKSIHEYLCVLVIYFTIKSLVKKDKNKISLLIALLIPGLLNNIISWSQFFDLIESNNHFFRFTGFFNNPGPSAIFSGINFLLCFLLLNNLKEKNNRLKLFIFINLVLGFPGFK